MVTRRRRKYDRRVSWSGPRAAFVADLVICAALLALAAPPTTGWHAPAGYDAGTVLDTVLLPALVLPILLRRRAPLAAAAAFAAGCVVSGIPTFDQFRLIAAVPAGLLILFSLAVHAPRRRALGGLALVLVGIVFVGLTDVALDQPGEGGVGAMIAFSFPLCLGAWGAGRLVRARDGAAARLAERSRQLDRQREQTAELAVEVERARLATDLDAAARVRLREIVARAAAGEQRDGRDGARTHEAFAWIEREGRRSLNEMRALLGVLRSDVRSGQGPRPTLAQVEALLADARAGGRLVELEVEGERRPLPGAVELAAYRALQHGLVAVRGADGEPATVHLRYGADGLELELDGVPARGAAADAALAAARERVTAQGGRFEERTAEVGRRRLRAHLPVAVADA
jgi:signal transduction histidine kinase